MKQKFISMTMHWAIRFSISQRLRMSSFMSSSITTDRWQHGAPQYIRWHHIENQPWEIEAFRDQGHLAWSVCSQMVAERKELAMGWGCHSGMLGEAFKYVSAFRCDDKRFQTFASFCVV